MIDLQTKAELEELQNKFTYAADRRDYEAIRRLYHADAFDDHGLFKGSVDGLIEWLKDIQNAFEMSAHILTNFRFECDGDYAESEVRGSSYLRLKADPATNMIVIGRHFDKYERRNGTWRFLHRTLCVDWVQKFPPGDGSIDVVTAIAMGKMGPDDPFYSRLKLLPANC